MTRTFRPLLPALLLLVTAVHPAGAAERRASARERRTTASRSDARQPELQRTVFAARDAVLPALVHVTPILEVYSRGQKQKAAVTGSGVIMDAAGHVLTNNHVVSHAKRVTCILYDKRELTAHVVGTDTSTDVAVLQLDLAEGEDVPVATLGESSTLSAGQYVIAMGSPLGLARSISVGVVSTPDRYFPEDFLPTGEITGTYNTWVQTDAAINPGNSGGPLVDLSGRVIGINARAVPIFGENIGFAIPIDVVRDVASQILANGSVTRSWIGVLWQDVKGLGQTFGAERGVLVGGVVPGSPAEQANLRAGDLLLAWNGRPVNVRFEEELPAFRKLIADTPIGTRVPVRVLRQGQEVPLEVVTETAPDADSDETEVDDWGMTVRDVTPEIARRRRIKDPQGVLVTGVKNAAPAAVAGIDDGDVLREIGGRRVTSVESLMSTLEALRAEHPTRLLVRFDRGVTHRLAAVVLSD
jgi:serine protease Do